MNGILKGMLVMLVIVYLVSPLDLCPGPIDDILLLLFSCSGRKASKRQEN